MKYTFFLLIVLALISNLLAQSNEFLPLSRYGYGSLSRTYSPFSQGCGHAGLAYTSPEEYNSMNPASLGFLRFTDAEIGFNVKKKEISNLNNSVQDLSGTLSYLQIGIPLHNTINEALEHKERKHKFGLSVGLLPFSSTSYSYLIEDSSSIGNYLRRLNGSGGLNQFQIGVGYKYKNFAAGMNLGYIFGNLEYDQTFNLSGVIPAAQDNYVDRYFGSGISTQFSFIYQQFLNQKEITKDKSVKAKALNYSLLIGLPSRLNMSRYSLHTSVLNLNPVGLIIDTLSFQDNDISKSDIPFKLVGGISYNNKEKSGIVLDAGLENWGSAKLFEGNKGELVNDSYFSLGGWIKPDNTGYGNVLKRSQYRIGGFYEKGYLSLNDESLTNYGVTLGMATAFNFQRQLCVVNLGIELGQSKLQNFITEKYIKLNLGIRINDSEWFLKRRYN
ncbi:MAG: hypothetical protein ABIO44_06605 [Saprospiraceae bacterium]